LPASEAVKFENAMRLYSYRKQVDAFNYNRLRDIREPILRVYSTDTGKKAGQASEEDAAGLEKHFNVCISGKMMLTRNLWVERGLCNGTIGIVRDIVWKLGQDVKKERPVCIMLEVDGYTGPTFLGTNYVPVFSVL
jgi:hypothetical protein